MEENKNFEFSDLFKGKNLAIVILSVLLFFTILAVGNSDSSDKDNQIKELTNSVEQLQQQVKTLENDKTNLQTKNTELQKQVEELKTSKVEEPAQPTSAKVEVADSTPIQSDTVEEPTTNDVEEDYVLNTNTKKFHYSSCSSAKQIKSSNRKDFSGTRDELINQGYKPCQKCNP